MESVQTARDHTDQRDHTDWKTWSFRVGEGSGKITTQKDPTPAG